MDLTQTSKYNRQKYDFHNQMERRTIHTGNGDTDFTLTGDIFLFFIINGNDVFIMKHSPEIVAEWLSYEDFSISDAENTIQVIKFEDEELREEAFHAGGFDVTADFFKEPGNRKKAIKYDISMNEIDALDKFKRRFLSDEYCLWFSSYRKGWRSAIDLF